MAARVAQVHLQADEAPARFTLVGLIIGAGLGAIFTDESYWPLVIAATLAGFLGMVFGFWRRKNLRIREAQLLKMLETVERNSP